MASPLGKPVRRREDAALLKGLGHYVEDITLPGTRYIAFVRSPYAKARIVNVHKEQAGAHLVITADDLAHLPDMPLNQRARGMQVPPNPVLARGTANAVGIAVAAVVAETRAAAEDAASLLEVEYEPLTGVADATSALNDEAP